RVCARGGGGGVGGPLRGGGAAPPPAVPCGRHRAAVSGEPWPVSSRATDRVIARASTRAGQPCQDATAIAAANMQSPRTVSRAAGGGLAVRRGRGRAER